MNTNKRQEGFSLIELLIVVAIIGIIAAIAIPNLIASRRAANEGSAQASMRVLTSAEATYQATTGAGNYGNLPALFGAFLIDGALNGAVSGGGAPKSGYFYQATAIAPNAGTGTQARYALTARPSNTTGVTATGTRRFVSDESGVMFFDSTDLTTDELLSPVGAGLSPIGN